MSPYCRGLYLEEELQPITVQVFFPGDVFHKDMLEMYFESSKRSGGGHISNISIDQSSKCAFVTFDDPDGKKWDLQLADVIKRY